MPVTLIVVALVLPAAVVALGLVLAFRAGRARPRTPATVSADQTARNRAAEAAREWPISWPVR